MRFVLFILIVLAAGTSTAQVSLLEIGGGPGSNSNASVFTGSELDRCPNTIGENPNRKFDANQLVDSATSECVSTVSGADAAGNGSASYFVSEVAGTITQITAAAEGTASSSVSQTEEYVADAQGFGSVFVNVEVTSRVLASIQTSVSSGGDSATGQVRVGSPSNCLIFGNCTLLNKVCSTTTNNGCFPPLGGFVDDLPDTLVLEPGTYRFDVNAGSGVSNNISVRDPKSGTASASFTVTFTSLEDTGACCLPDGSCEERTEAVCNAVGGTYQGDGTTCATVTCPEPKGACCLGPGECDFITQAECQALSGFYRGDGVPCEDGLCDCALSWASSQGGSLDAEASWSPAEVPEDCDTLTFDLGGEYDVTFGDTEVRSVRVVNASPRFNGGNLFLRATDVGLAVGGAGTAKLTLRSGEIQIPFGAAQIGTAAGAPGEFELGGLDGSAANCLIKQFDVGIGVAGKVNILKGGNLIAGDARIGVTSPEPSIMNVVAGGVFDMDSSLIVGNAGDAVLNVFGGGTVLCDELTTSVAGIGKLRLSDSGTSLRARGNADVGFGEVAELSIEKEAMFTTDKILFVGKGGATTVTVTEQGVLNANEARIGVQSAEECFLNVKKGANFNVSTDLGIGFGSDATANVTEGGVVTCGDLTLAIVGLGTLNIVDQGSRVNVSGDFLAGFDEDAEVVIEKNASMRVTGKLTAGQGGRASVIVDFGTLDVLGDIQLGDGEFADLLALAATINAANIRVGGPSFGKALVSTASVLTATSLRVEPNGEFRIEGATLNVPTISFNGTNFVEVNPRKQIGGQNVINGNVTFGASSVTVFSVADGATPLLEINGSCVLGGTAEIRFADDAVLLADQELELIGFGETPSGAFSTFRFPTRSGDFSGNTRVEDGRLILTVVNPGTPVAGEGEGEGEGEGDGCTGCNAKRIVRDPWGALKDSLGDNLIFLASGLALVLARRATRR